MEVKHSGRRIPQAFGNGASCLSEIVITWMTGANQHLPAGGLRQSCMADHGRKRTVRFRARSRDSRPSFSYPENDRNRPIADISCSSPIAVQCLNQPSAIATTTPTETGRARFCSQCRVWFSISSSAPPHKTSGTEGSPERLQTRSCMLPFGRAKFAMYRGGQRSLSKTSSRGLNVTAPILQRASSRSPMFLE